MNYRIHILPLIAALGMAAPALHAGTEATGKDVKPVVTPEPESRFKIYGWVDAGFTYNGDRPDDHQNFGRLFDDRANEPMLNQFVLTAERALKPEPGEWDWGFKAQVMMGSDARFIHTLGEFNNTMNDIIQPDVVEAYLSLHAPLITEGGMDLKVGQFVTLCGQETIDPRTNFFYSHSWMFNFGIPFKHVGALLTTHLTPWLDLNTGLVRGINMGLDDNNDVWAFHGGLALNLLEGKFSVAATTHIGAENDAVYEPLFDTNSRLREIYDVVVTWKTTDKLTATTDLNYGHDDGFDAEWYGAAQYLTYAVNDWFSVGVRGEVWRDDDGFAAAQFGNFDDPIDLQRGDFKGLDPRTVGGGDTTYGSVTVGANIRLPGKLKDHVVIRPEVRYDCALEGARNKPFDDSSDRDQFTAAVDAVITF